jgi:hypothetical protein
LPSDGDVLIFDEPTQAWIPEPPPVPPGGTGDLSYTHNQSVPAATWNITHSLGKFPSVTAIDSVGNVVEGSIVYIDVNNLTISFVSAFSGKAYLN